MNRIKKSILVILAILVLLFISLIGLILIDMNNVEKTAESCLPLIAKINAYKSTNKKYPDAIGEISNNNAINTICNYQPDNNSFIFTLAGSKLNMQTYVYNSELNIWYWD